MAVTDKPALPTADQDITRGFLHRALVFFHTPEAWSRQRFLLTVAAVLITNGLIWFLVSGSAATGGAVGLTVALFTVGDGLLFWSLPRLNISFGPWRAQLGVLLTARSGAALAALSLLLFFDAGFGLLINLAGQTLGTALLMWGTLVEPFRLQLTRLKITTPHLPPGSEPLRILHISDLHVERLGRREARLEQLVAETPKDLIVITGDYLNLSYTRDARAQLDARAVLQKLEAPHGVYAVLGSPPVDERDVVPSLFEDLHIQLLMNETMTVDLGDRRTLTLVAVDCSHHLEADAARLSALTRPLPSEKRPRLLLYHAPDLMPEAVRAKIDLLLCGHTHGGQVRIPGYGALLTSSRLGKRYEMGHYHEGQTHLYVSRGLGFEGLSAPRVRLFSPPEITLVILEPAA